MARRRDPLFWLGSGMLVGFIVVALLAPLLAPQNPRLSTGRPFEAPTRAHPLGTNDLGQDLLSQLVYGARSSLLIAGGVTVISTALSWTVGLLAGYFRRAETLLMMLTDLFIALPTVPMTVLVMSLLGPSRRWLILALGFLAWPSFARVVRSIVLATRSAPYVEAARALGASDARIVRRHVLPSTLDVLPVKLVLTVRYAVFAEAALAFLGLGSNDALSWGQMLNWAFSDPLLFARPAWPWLVLPPTLAIATLVVASAWASGRPA